MYFTPEYSQALLDQAADLYNDIYEWYDRELKSYNPNA